MIDPAVLTIIENEAKVLLIGPWRAAVLAILADEVVARVDWRRATGFDRLASLDDPLERWRLVDAHGAKLYAQMSDVMRGERKRLDGALDAAAQRQLNGAKLESAIGIVVPPLISSVTFNHMIVDSPFPDLWKVASDVVAGQLVTSWSGMPEWQRSHGLALAAVLRMAQLPRARDLERSIRSHGLLGLRGSLVRMPAVMDAAGIHEPTPPLLTVPAVPRARPSFELLGAVDRERRDMMSGRGTMHQILDTRAPAPPSFPGTADQFAAIRSAGYALYEHTIVAYLALSATEQLLRAWAQHLGHTHLKGGSPAPLAGWAEALPLSPALKAKLDDFYDPTGLNLRNRIMHGALLESEAVSYETTLRAGVDAGFPSMPRPGDGNGFAPANVANLCVDLLAHVEIEAPGALSAADRTWESTVVLTDEELRWGALKLPGDFLTSDAELHRSRLFKYLRRVYPVAATMAQLGFHAWIGAPAHDRQRIQCMYLPLVFEALYRLTVQLLGESVLQVSVKAGQLRVQYRMLDEREGSLFHPAIVGRLVKHLAPTDQQVARRVLGLAVKARNASAHGAVPDLTELRRRGEGHIFVKAMQCLMEAGMHHMTREAAYYRWQRQAASPGAGAVESDWLVGEAEVERLVFDTE